MNPITKMFLILGFGTCLGFCQITYSGGNSVDILIIMLLIPTFGSAGAVQSKNAASVWLRAAACAMRAVVLAALFGNRP